MPHKSPPPTGGHGKPHVQGHDNSLRDWADHSYDVLTGRSASSIEGPGPGRRGNHTTDVQSQITAAHGKAEGRNNPGVEAMNKSGSGDPGRRKYGATDIGP
jgi:hypothetical protein